MDPKTLAERVGKLSKSTSELVRSHVDGLEARAAEDEKRKRVKVTKRSAPTAKALPAAASPVAPSNTLPTTDEANTLFTNAGAILPPYEPETLVALFEHSSALRPNVDSYVTNIESFGGRFEPLIDLDAADADKKIGDAMFLDRLYRAGDSAVAQAPYPTAEEIANKRTEVTHAMRLERAKLDAFIDSAVPDDSFVGLREKSRNDHEVTGNGYWEVRRNAAGRIAQFTYVPAHSVRLLPIEYTATEIRARERISLLSTEYTTRHRRFRRFVQIVANRVMYFREFGDPRAMNALTGLSYASVEAMREQVPDAIPATEIVHFKVHSARSPYGVPRWIGSLLSVLGSRAAEEVNYLYFDNKAIPPLAVLVSGGRLAADAKTRIESFIDDHIKGKNNFHKILIIEAVGPNAQGTPGLPEAGRVRIEIEKLHDAQQQDALFQTYDERNIDKIGSAFRVPRLLRGDVRDFNRATAEAALEYAETQVFGPERNRFDEFMNRQILPDMGVRFWRYVSNTPISRDPSQLTEWIVKFVTANVLTPAEARDLARDVFNRELKRIDDDWAQRPIQITLAGLGAGLEMPAGDAATPAAEGEATPAATAPKAATPMDRNLAAVAANLSALRDRLRSASKAAAERIEKQTRREYDEGEVVTIELSKAEIDQLVERDAAAE